LAVIGFDKSGSPQLKHCFMDTGNIFSLAFWASIATFVFNWQKVIFAAHPPGYGLHWDVLWSLSIEEQFYFFYPLLLKRLGDERRLVVFLGGMILLGPLSILLGWQFFPHNNNVLYNSFAAFNLIAMGCLLYLVSERTREFLLRERGKCWLLCFFGFAIIFIFYFHIYVRVDYWWTVLANSFIGIGAFLFLLGGFHLKAFESKLLAVFCFPGKLSYGMYLLHALALYFLWSYLGDKNQFVAFFIFVVATVAIAAPSYRYFEIPDNLFIRKLFRR